MSLRLCKSCKRDVSEEASTCPNCGHPNPAMSFSETLDIIARDSLTKARTFLEEEGWDKDRVGRKIGELHKKIYRNGY